MWFEVDKEGLSKVVERHGIAFLLRELIANGFDAPGVTFVKVTMIPVPHAPFVKITVEDDSPEGFTQLSHAWTLYAESNRKGDSEKRGRFNIGEKLVLSRCRDAEISTTTGTVIFDDSPPYRHHYPSRCRERGSVFVGEGPHDSRRDRALHRGAVQDPSSDQRDVERSTASCSRPHSHHGG